MTSVYAQAAARIAAAALLAAILSLACNRLARRAAGARAVVLMAPGFEESFKTGAALLLGAPVLATHISFGFLEALYDLSLHLRATAKVGRGAGAAVSGLAGHALFGFLTAGVAGLLGSWTSGVVAAYLVHVGWNALVMGRLTESRG